MRCFMANIIGQIDNLIITILLALYGQISHDVWAKWD